MSFTTAALIISSGYVCIACLYFVIHPGFKIGILGVIGLSILSIAALGRFSGLIEHCIEGHRLCDVERFTPGVLAWVGLAIYFVGVCLQFRKDMKEQGKGIWEGM